VQNLLVVGTPTGQTSMSDQSDRYVASTTCTRKPLPGRDPIGEAVSSVDLALASQLDPPPSATRMRGDKKLVFGTENYGLEIKK
jgi:hypothetical protein